MSKSLMYVPIYLKDKVFVIEELKSADLPKNTVIALFEAGMTPFFLPQFRYHDLLGKNDRAIARTAGKSGLVGHNKWDYDYSLGKIEPDLILARDGYSEIDEATARQLLQNPQLLPPDAVLFGIDLWMNPEFRANYRTVDIPTPHNTHWVFARRGADIGRLRLVGERTPPRPSPYQGREKEASRPDKTTKNIKSS